MFPTPQVDSELVADEAKRLRPHSFVTHDGLLELGEGDHFGERELFYRHQYETDQLLQQNVMLKLGMSTQAKLHAKPLAVDLPVSARKRHQDALVTPQWAGNASLYFLRWEDIVALRESKNIASRTIFTIIQNSASKRVAREQIDGSPFSRNRKIWSSREDTMHYSFAKTIQNFYRRHRKEAYNHSLESSLKGLDPYMEVVMRAVMGALCNILLFRLRF